MKKTKSFNYVVGRKYDGMMGRCYRESDRSYANYGGRGIGVCSKWIEDINNFKVWLMAELFKNGIMEVEFVKNSKIYQLDRIDVNGHYIPENCRIVNPQQNSRNKQTGMRTVRSAEGTVHKI